MPAPVLPRSALIGAGLLVPLATAATMSAFRDQVSTVHAVLVLVLVVVAVAAGGSRLAGVLAALSSAAWFDFFLLRPYLTFTIAGRDGVETAVLLVLVGLAVAEIVVWGRRHQAAASRREGYLSGMVGAARLVATGGASPEATVELIGRQVREVLGVERCEYVAGPPVTRPRLGPDGRVRRGEVVIDVDRSGLPTNDVVDVPVTRGGVAHGRFVLTATSRVVWTTLEQRLVAVTLAEQAAAALAPAPERSPGRPA